MKQKNIAPKLKSNLDIKSQQYVKNKEIMLDKLNGIKIMTKEKAGKSVFQKTAFNYIMDFYISVDQ